MDIFQSNSTVLSISLVIWLGISIYLFFIDRKISALEEKHNEEDDL